MKLCLILAFGLFFWPSATLAFLDVTSDHSHATAIDYVEDQGIVSGYPDGTFRPDNLVNRVELLKILLESTDTQNLNCTRANLSDVAWDTWYSDYLHSALCESIVSGYPDGTFKPGQPVNFVEGAKMIVNAYGWESGTDGVWYTPFVKTLETRRAIPLSVTRFDHALTRGEMAEMIYRIAVEPAEVESQTFANLETNTAVQNPEPPTPEQPLEPQVEEPKPESEIPTDQKLLEFFTPLLDVHEFFPGTLLRQVKETAATPVRTQGDYHLVAKGNISLWWTRKGITPARTILLIEGETTPRTLRGLWEKMRGSTLEDIIVYSVPSGQDESAVSAAHLPQKLEAVVNKNYGGTFDFRAGIHATGKLIVAGALKTHLELLNFPTTDLYLTAGRELPETSWKAGVSALITKSAEPTNYVEITHAGTWNRPLDIEGLELTDTTVYYDDGNVFGFWGAGQFESTPVVMYYYGPLVKSKDPRDYLEAQVGFGSETMSLPLYLKLIAAYNSRLPNSSTLMFGEISSAKKEALAVINRQLDELPLELITIKNPPLKGFQFESGDPFPGTEKFNAVLLGPLAQNKDGINGPFAKIKGEAHLLGSRFGDFDLLMDERQTKATAGGSLDINLGTMGGIDLSTWGGEANLDLLTGDQVHYLKLSGGIKAGPLASERLAVNLTANQALIDIPASCALPFNVSANSGLQPRSTFKATDLQFTPQVSLPDPAKLISCPEDLYFVIKNGVAYAFNGTIKLAEFANSYLPENEVTRIGIEGLKFAGGQVIEAPEEILNLAQTVPGVGELTDLSNKLKDEAAKKAQEAAEEAARQAAEAARLAAEAAKAAAKAAADAAKAAVNEGFNQISNYSMVGPSGVIESFTSVFNAVGGIFGGSSPSLPGFGFRRMVDWPLVVDISATHNTNNTSGNIDNWAVTKDGKAIAIDDFVVYFFGGSRWQFAYSEKTAGLPADFPGFARIDAGPDGDAVAVDRNAKLWSFDGSRWNLTNASYAIDAGIGGGWLWAISGTPHPEGWPGNTIWRARYTKGQTHFNWEPVAGAGWRIDAGSDGRPWATQKTLKVWEWTGPAGEGTDSWVYREAYAIDVTVSASNRAWIIDAVDYNNGIGGGRIRVRENLCLSTATGLYGCRLSGWQYTQGGGVALGAGAGVHVWVATVQGDLWVGTGRK